MNSSASSKWALRALPPRKSPSGPGVMLFINLPQTLLHHMGIDLRSRDAGMAQHQLHRTQVGAALEQMSCKTVTQLVRRQFRAQPRLAAVVGQDSPKANAAEPDSPAPQEQIRRGTLAQ